MDLFISNKIISYYRNLGYRIIPNQINKIKVEDLLKNSGVKIDTKCDVCGKENNINYQKYNKNISKYNLYTCVKCSSIKNKMTYKEQYGNENYVNTEKLKETVKDKYDIITNKIQNKGVIECIKCLIDKNLSEYLIKDGRYKHVCRECRNIKTYVNRNKNPHIKAWRDVLRGYLSRKNLKIIDKTFNLLKYSPEEFRSYISKIFYNNMTWDNHGDEWHVDHIIHVSFFKEDTPCYVANSLENLRPLNNLLNISRHNNIDDDLIKLYPQYKTYIKDEYIKLIENKNKTDNYESFGILRG